MLKESLGIEAADQPQNKAAVYIEPKFNYIHNIKLLQRKYVLERNVF